MPMFRIGCPIWTAIVIVVSFAATSPAGQIVSGIGSGPPRDGAPPPRTGTGVVSGRVVDGVTGAAIARARVTVQSGKRASVTTDGNGAFVFTGLPMGPVTISVD